MSEICNVLILSCGTRNKIVQYFKKELGSKGKVIATDCSPLAPALYEADSYYITPKITADNYLELILDICKKETIHIVFSLIDPELSLIAKNKKKFDELGVTVAVSPYETVELCFDKMNMFQFLSNHHVLTPLTYDNLEDVNKALDEEMISFPVFVKPNRGSASLNISLAHNIQELELLMSQSNMITQQFMNGKEYGVDVYVDLKTGELVSYFIKEKLKMRAGETDKAISTHNRHILDLVKKVVTLTSFRGMLDFDVFEVNGEYYLSEINPRFGGGYPHAYECGVNFPKLILENQDKNLKYAKDSYEDDMIMMKYNEVSIRRG